MADTGLVSLPRPQPASTPELAAALLSLAKNESRILQSAILKMRDAASQ
jgi:hypothetical protein